VAMYFCIFRGVRLVGKIVWLTVPLPWLMLLVLTVRGLTLQGSMEGLAYYLNPDWSQLAEPTTWRFAFGQAFFSLSLAFGGVMITYASFLHRKSDLNNNAAIIALSDFTTSFVAGLAVFATLGGMAFVTRAAGHPVAVENVAEGGPSLAFIAFPYALAQLPYSAWFSFIFFFALVTLGIDSAFSITESVLAAIVDKTGWRRDVVLPVMSVVGLSIGLIYITQGGLNWLGVINDFIDGTWGIAFLGLLECLVLGWLWRIDILRRHANERSDWRLGRWWDYLIRIGIPIVLGSLFFWSLFDDLTRQGGLICTPNGTWNVTNCVGLSVIVLIPVLAILISLARGRPAVQQQNPHQRSHIQGNAVSGLSLFFALASAVLLADMFRLVLMGRIEQVLLWISLPLAIAAVLIGNYLLDRCNAVGTRSSLFARWAGIIGVMDISCFVALLLVLSGRSEETTKIVESTYQAHEQLSTASYVILSVVFLLIICGLGWCFYRALSAASAVNGPQGPQQDTNELE
jgi:NSS family neurotransmitter:Na+ symporter